MSDVAFDFKNENHMEVHGNYAEPWKVTLVDTGDNTMTGGRVKQVQRYIGVDPFLGDSQDPYRGSYWQNKDEATNIYRKTKKIFDKYNQTLICTTSDEYFLTCKEKTFDLIFVDGDHCYNQALKDMENAIKFLKDDGVLLVDDYANVDVPEVTRAVSNFIHRNQHKIKKLGYETLEFRNKGKYVPVSLTICIYVV